MRKFLTRSRTVRRLRVFAVFFILFALLNRIESHHWRVWQATILAKEYGHWFAVLGLVIAFRFWWWRRRGWSFAVLIATLLFAGPTWDALSLESTWKEELRLGLQSQNQVADLLSIKTLFFGRWEDKVPVERVAYSTKDQLGFDFYRSKRSGKSPFVVVIHGGGWNSGSAQQLSEVNVHLANLGYAVASIDYRLAPEFKWPAPREDVEAAIAYLKSHGQELGLDPDNYFLLGRSAGGQIALATAYQSRDSALRGVISFYAPTDLVFGYEVGEENDILGSRPLIRGFLGGSPYEQSEKYADASPIERGPASQVPTLLLHGRPDPLVWFKHSERLIERLKRAHVKAAYIESWSATHGFDWSINGPAGQVSTSAIEYFLNEFSKAK